MEAGFENLDPGLGQNLRAIQASVKTLTAKRNHKAGPEGFDAIDQGDRMLKHLETWLLDEEQKQALGQDRWSVFFLHLSAYLCDIGLLSSADDVNHWDRLPEGTDIAALVLAVADASRKQIATKWLDLGLQNETHAGIVADICHPGHIRSYQLTTNPDGLPLDTSLLSGCIRLARALELKAPITSMEIWGLLPGDNRLTPGELGNFFEVLYTGSHPFFTGTVQVTIKCRHPEVHRALKHHETTVQSLLSEINREVSPRFLYSDVTYEIKPDGYEPVDLKFAVDSSAAVKLFMGNRLYTDKRVFLRELIQNAADACRLKKLADSSYEPAISISFNEDISTITVRDNGIGMSRQWIEKYFLAIGISFYRSGEIRTLKRKARLGVSFISQFGIGFLSGFLVAERIVIKTKKAGSDGLIITIADPHDYFDVRPLKESADSGTEVVLYLKESKINYSRRMEYPGYLGTHIRFLGIPVRLIDECGNISVLGNEAIAYTKDETPGLDFVAKLTFPNSVGYLLLSGKCHTDKTMYAIESVIGGISVFQDGIFVRQIDSLLPEGARHLVAGRINLLGNDKCDLSMDRNRIFWTKEQLEGIKKTIRYGLVDLANQLVAEIQGQDLSKNTRNSILNNVSIFFDFSEVDDTMHRELCEPIRQIVEKRFRDFLRINFAHTLRRSGIVGAEGYSENWQQTIVATFAGRKNKILNKAL